MKWENHLIEELSEIDSVEYAETGVVNGLIKIEIEDQLYDRINSDLLTLIGRYDVSLYTAVDNWDLWLVEE